MLIEIKRHETSRSSDFVALLECDVCRRRAAVILPVGAEPANLSCDHRGGHAEDDIEVGAWVTPGDEAFALICFAVGRDDRPRECGGKG